MVGPERLRRLSEHLRGGASALPPDRAVPAAAELRAAPAAAQLSEELAPKLLPGEPELSHAEAHRRSLELLSSAAPPEEEAWRAAPPLELSEEQLNFFSTFGYLSLPGLLADRADQIIADFEEVWQFYGGGHGGLPHDGEQRSCIVPFLDSHPNLCSLIDDPRIIGLADGLLGPEWNLMGSDGNYYAGDTGCERRQPRLRLAQSIAADAAHLCGRA